MKRLMLLFILVGSLTAQTSIERIVSDYFNETKSIFAPDKRTAILNIEFNFNENVVLCNGETNLADAKDYFFFKLQQNNIKYMDNVNVIPDETIGDRKYGIINVSVANLRSEPKHASELVTQSLLGTVVNILKKSEDNWYLIQTPDLYLGWVDEDGISRKNESEINSYKKSHKIIFLSVYGFSFSEMDRESIPVSDLVIGNIIEFISIEKEFYKVKYPDGRLGFVDKNEAELFSDWLTKTKPISQKIISTAKKFMGIPYLWGGTSAKGFDCSGFTKTVYYLNGLVLPRDASQQINVGEEVDDKLDFNVLQPGDLLFFGRKATDTTPERATHVGIYIGDTQFIHASGLVLINSLDSSRKNFSQYRFSNYLKAKRLFSGENILKVQKISESNYY